MKKLLVIAGLVTGTLLMGCSASVNTRKHGAAVKVGSIEKVEPAKNVKS